MKGHFAKAQTAPKRYLTEIRVDDPSAFELGQEFTVAELEEGAKLDVTGVSKGKGTQGNIKRHGHHRGPETHGSKHKRLPGGLAAGTYPSRVFKGNKAPGRMGRETTTVQNLELVKVLADRNVVLVKGAVPGPKGGLLKVRYAVKGQK
jgi:large subunit ribosomal protein L3